jgi:hypothetical protein
VLAIGEHKLTIPANGTRLSVLNNHGDQFLYRLVGSAIVNVEMGHIYNHSIIRERQGEERHVEAGAGPLRHLGRRDELTI